MTDKPATLAAALVAFQAEVPTIPKTKTAKVKGTSKAGATFDYSYKYADLADFSAVVLPLLARQGLCFTSQTGYNDGRFGLSYQLLHESGELIDGFVPLDISGGPQRMGGEMTYARRYALSAVTGVAADEDTDAQHVGPPGDTERRGRGQREKPPPRPLEDLPRNQDGTLSRSRCTVEELDLYGNMTPDQMKEHTALRKGAAKGKEPAAEHLSTTPPDDSWYANPNGGVRVPQPAPSARNAIFGHFNRLKGDGDPFTDDERYNIMSAITRHTIRSTNDLTAAQGVEVLRFLEKCRDRDVLIERLAVHTADADV